MRLIALAIAAFAALPAPALAQQPVTEGPVPRAQCGPGSQPEPPDALQGEVTAKDRDSGRSLKPYTCNLDVVGNDPGPGASWQNTWYDHCDYYDTKLSSGLGVQVVDVADPAKPKITEALTSPAMLDPWESLSVAEHRPDNRKLLAGVYVNGLQGSGFFDVYDVAKDCARPSLVSSLPLTAANHEGNWSMDGMTYYTSAAAPGGVEAIDVSDPSMPTPITFIPISLVGHGLSTSDDGNRLYYATPATLGGGNGLTILDTSQIQARQPGATASVVGQVTWADGSTAQMTIPVTWNGKPYVVFDDELGQGAARIIDISDEKNPKVVSKIKLEIQMPQNADRAAETGSDNTFGYDSHYCNVDRRVDPTILVCSEFESGERVFDVRDPLHPKEIAYYNPGGTGQPGKAGSQDNASTVTSGYPSARPRIIPERGEIWFTDQDKGLFVARFTNGVWPFKDSAPTPGNVGLPKAKACLRRAVVRVRLRNAKRARSAVVQINGRRVRSLRGAALRRPVAIRLPKGHSIVRIVVRTRSGRRVAQVRDYTRC